MKLYAEFDGTKVNLENSRIKGSNVVTKEYNSNEGKFFGINNGKSTVILDETELNQFTGINNTKESLRCLNSTYTVAERIF